MLDILYIFLYYIFCVFLHLQTSHKYIISHKYFREPQHKFEETRTVLDPIHQNRGNNLFLLSVGEIRWSLSRHGLTVKSLPRVLTLANFLASPCNQLKRFSGLLCRGDNECYPVVVSGQAISRVSEKRIQLTQYAAVWRLAKWNRKITSRTKAVLYTRVAIGKTCCTRHLWFNVRHACATCKNVSSHPLVFYFEECRK